MKTIVPVAIVALALSNPFQASALVTIAQHPPPQVVSLKAHVTLEVTASSTAPPITCQWYGKGALLPDQTGRTLVLNDIQIEQAGEYYVVVGDADSQPVQSNLATVTVDPRFVKITEGDIANDREPSYSSTWLDYDGDGHLDVYLLNSDASSGERPARASLYRGFADGSFKRITNSLSARVARNVTAAVADYDHDGDDDLYVLGNTWPTYDYRPDDLYQNRGDGEFTAVPGQSWSLDLDNSADCGWADYDRDGLPDLYVADANLAAPECLYRQRTEGGFAKMTAAQAGTIVTVNLAAYACAWADYDNDGDPDLWVSSGDGHCRLHQNDGRGYFSAATNAGTITTVPANGTGVWGDYDNDGWLDFFTVASPWGSVTTAVNALHRNLEGTSFIDVASAAGVAMPNDAWASAWGDYDNDGWLDLFVANFTGGTNLLYRNLGDGTFEALDVGSPIRDGDLRATVAWVDYDNDGFLDLFITCGNGTPLPNHLYRNNALALGNANHWLKIELNGQAANRSGIGARICVKATIDGQEVWQVREISGNSGYQGGYGLMAHFGLGDATKADIVRVEWPSGNVEELADVSANQLRSITETVGITPVRPSSSLGGSVTLTAQLNGTWQWYHDDVALEGQTAKTLVLSNIRASDAGRYSVAVTTASGSVSHYVYLLVDTQFERIDLGDTGASWGCAWGDCDNDDYPDLFIGQGIQSTAQASVLYRNEKGGNLSRVTADEAGDIVRLARNWNYAGWADYDNDGDLDLVVSDNPETGEPQPALWRNLGNGRFEDATLSSGSFLTDRLWGTPRWADFNRDGLLDLAVSGAWDEPPSWPDWSRNLLYFNQGDGTFRKETQDPFVAYRARAMIEGMAIGDLDGDGDPDMVLGGHGGVLMFENDGSGHFRQVPFPVLPGRTLSPSLADYDNDGRLDVFIGVYDWTGAYPHRLLKNEGSGQWSSMSLSVSYEGGGGAWADYDNDGDLDLYIVCGRIETTPNLFYANNGDGTFTQITLGSLGTVPDRSRSAAWADYDNNGFPDLLVTGRDGFSDVIYRNQGNGNHWIAFKLIGTRSNRSAIGAKVRLQASIFGQSAWQMREVGTGNLAQNDLRPHFGLGDAPRATTVRVEWPSGTVEEFANLSRDQFHTIVEPSMRGAMKANGEFELSVWASTNRSCAIEYSPDLVNWTILDQRQGAGESPILVPDPGSPGQDHRFYRMR